MPPKKHCKFCGNPKEPTLYRNIRDCTCETDKGLSRLDAKMWRQRFSCMTYKEIHQLFILIEKEAKGRRR